MIKNVGNLDRIVRFALAASMGLLLFTEELSGGAMLLLGSIAVIFVATSCTGTCPLYSLTKLSTKK